jgi:hypothetical protein
VFAAIRLMELWVRIPPAYGCLSLLFVECCQVEVSAKDLSLVERSPTDSEVSGYNPTAPIIRMLWLTRGFGAMGKKIR